MEKYIEVAAHWWAEKLRNPALSSFNMGSGLAVYEEASKAGLSLAEQNSANTQKIDQFEKRLAEWITTEMEQYDVVYLMCDYHPGGSLYTIALECDISENLFPWKTFMTIRKDSVVVRCGYGAAEEVLFPIG